MGKIRQMLTRKKNRKATKEDTRIIGIVGAGRHVGVTHLTVLLANYFSVSVENIQQLWSGTVMGILTVLEGHVQEKRRQNVMRSRMSAFILMGMRWSWENVSEKL